MLPIQLLSPAQIPLRIFSRLQRANAPHLRNPLEVICSLQAMQQLIELEAAINADTELLQRILRSVGSSSIALLALLDDHGKHVLELAGSGTLVIVKDTHYILTAAHVWEKVLKLALRLGITITDNINHKYWIDIKAIVPTICKPSRSQWDEWGPDLALLRIPTEYVGGIKAFQVFEDVTTPGKPLNVACLQYWVLMGTPKELGTFSPNHADLQISGFFVNPRYHRCGKHDYYDVLMDTSENHAPKSFGGVSGGGLWRILVYISPETRKIDWLQRLKGVAFYEFPRKNGARVLRCHGPSSLTAVTGETVELDVNTLAEAYLEEVRCGRDEGGWAKEQLLQSVRDDPIRGFALIALVLNNAESDYIVDNIAMGALKHLLAAHGKSVLNRVERGCEHSRRLRLAVGRVAQSDEFHGLLQDLKHRYSSDYPE